MNFSIVNLSNPGIVESKLPEETLVRIKNNYKNYILEKANHTLVGNIKEEYFYDIDKDLELQRIIIECYNYYKSKFGNTLNTCKSEIPIIKSVWLNLQQKNEFNPVHVHDADLSFVIWIRIPYDLKEELNTDYYTNPHYQLRKACFEIIYTTTLGQIISKHFYLDKCDEGKIFMFPSQMMHSVYPFSTADGYRISIAGNLYFECKDELEYS